MGNYITSQSSNTTGKVILPDGTVHLFDKCLTVAELMLEYPQQVVVEFRPDLSDKRAAPLPADEKLDVKKVYLMLPMKRGKIPSLSSEEARQILFSANSGLRTHSRSLLSSPSRTFLPLFARICSAEGHGFVLEKKESCAEKKQKRKKMKLVEERYDSELLLLEIMENRPEYLSRQLSGKGWKPSLDTIKEKKVEKKVPHWLFNF